MRINSIASKLKHLIVIEQALLEEDGAGGQIQSWKEYKKIWAEVKALYEQTGVHGEIFTAMQFLDNSFYRFRIRYLPRLNSAMRISYNGKIFHIKRIINQEEMNHITIIIAQESI